MKSLLSLLTMVIALTALPSLTQAEDDPSRWNGSMKEFQEEDSEKPFPKGGIVFAGSSSIRMWKSLNEDFPKHTVLRRGFGGSQMSDLLHHIDTVVLKHEPRQVVIYEGDNDIGKGKTAERVFADYIRVIDRIHAKLPDCHVTFIAIKPSLKRWALAPEMTKANGLIEKFSETDERLSYADVWKPGLNDRGTPREDVFLKDGLHLNEKGYQMWTRVIGKLLTPEKK